MQAVWQSQIPVSRAELEKKLPPEHPMAQTTLLTLLSRLTEKGFLTVEKVGKSNCYTPTITQEAYLSAQSRRFVDQLFGGSMSLFASALCDSGLSKEDLDQLRRHLEEGTL
jgi:predicted transcriptional regulator